MTYSFIYIFMKSNSTIYLTISISLASSIIILACSIISKV